MNFGGRNELERRLRAELQTGKVNCWDDGDGSFEIHVYFKISDGQARILGQVLSEGHPVGVLGLYSFHGMTATGDYEELMEFIKTHPKLQDFRINVSAESSEDVTSRFFHAMSQSTAIRALRIENVQHVPFQALKQLLHMTTSISDLTIWDIGLVDSTEIEAAFVGNTSVTSLMLSRQVNPTFFAGMLRSMKSNPTIVSLSMSYDGGVKTFGHLAQALPSIKGLRELACQKWPDALNAMMMDAFKRNGSVVQVTLRSYFHQEAPLDPLLQSYLKRNRGIQRVMESPGTVLDNLIPLICAAAEGTSLKPDLIFALVKAKAHLFQDVAS